MSPAGRPRVAPCVSWFAALSIVFRTGLRPGAHERMWALLRVGLNWRAIVPITILSFLSGPDFRFSHVEEPGSRSDGFALRSRRCGHGLAVGRPARRVFRRGCSLDPVALTVATGVSRLLFRPSRRRSGPSREAPCVVSQSRGRHCRGCHPVQSAARHGCLVCRVAPRCPGRSVGRRRGAPMAAVVASIRAFLTTLVPETHA